ncbi:MAG: hypothetical protein HC831_08185, partial [Chloroflexia bacterium]|nr:hypothetical protein [Chloroflexia bacterium]
DEEPWEEVLKEIEEHLNDYFEFDGISPRDSFNIMVDFAENIDNLRLQERLINALNKSKPYRNFKWQIDSSGEYRQKWFDFKKNRYIKWVIKQIEDYNSLDVNE